jgi:hypothetical protein
MNSIERIVYNLVKKNPRLKTSIIWLYQRILSTLQTQTLISDYEINIREGYFFGFHDKCPWSANNQYLLAHKFSHGNYMPSDVDNVKIGFFWGEDWNQYHSSNISNAWNWQTGSMLQWIGNSNEFIYNDYNGKHHVARIQNTDGKIVGEIQKPVSAVSPDGKYALSYSFTRLRKYATAYGYANGDNDSDIQKCPNSEYLSLINLKSDKVTNLYNLEDIINIAHESSMTDAYHYFTHCLFNPSSDRFVFFHRWINKHNQVKTRMMSSDINGSEIYIFPTSGMVSHIAWQDNDTILAYAATKLGDQYYLFKDLTDRFQPLNKDEFSEDGHPQYSGDGIIVTDTYPKRDRLQSLIIYDPKKELHAEIAKLKAPFSFTGDVRCDLHPRWDRNSEVICFDSAHTNKRSLCTLRLKIG